MVYSYVFTRGFKKELKDLSKNTKRYNQINKVLSMIKENPFDKRLEIRKISNYYDYRYKVGLKYRIWVNIKENKITFLKIGKRENFYSFPPKHYFNFPMFFFITNT